MWILTFILMERIYTKVLLNLALILIIKNFVGGFLKNINQTKYIFFSVWYQNMHDSMNICKNVDIFWFSKKRPQMQKEKQKEIATRNWFWKSFQIIMKNLLTVVS